MKPLQEKCSLFKETSAFTLIELVVTVLVIAVLAAVALPQYQHAVAKHRYEAMLPLAKAVYTGQEHFYLSHGHYTDKLTDLDISTAGSHPNGVSVALHQDDSSSYLLMTHAKLNNTLVMYNQHSQNYPSHIYCEAKQADELATWLCEKAMKGTQVENGSLTPGYTAYVLQGTAADWQETPIETPHDPVDYVNQSGIEMHSGDTCTATQAGACQGIDAVGSTCTSTGENGCSNSTYTDSTCQATGANGGCANSSYDEESSCSTIDGGKQGCAFSEFSNNSTCTAGQEGGTGTKPVAGCQRSIFTEGSTCVVNQNTASNAVDTACGGNDKGGKTDTTGANSAQYYGSECINESNSSFGCGRSWYKEGSTCTSNRTNGGCGNSLFDASLCIGRGGNACDKSKFINGAVCEAQAAGTCPINQSTYDSTSYCTGKNGSRYSYCPSGTPAPPTTPGGSTTERTWRACTSDDGAPKSGMSCYDD